jgi:hypothetical protein
MKKMKTLKNISNLKKLGLIVFGSLLLTAGSLNAKGYESAPNAYMISLVIFMNGQEETFKYAAPEMIDIEEMDVVMARLEEVILVNEARLKYAAPESTEEDLSAEMNRLEELVASTEDSLKYEAPIEDETIAVANELERLEMLAASTEASLKYSAPENADMFDEVTKENMLAQTK